MVPSVSIKQSSREDVCCCYYFSLARSRTLDGIHSQKTDSGIETITEKAGDVFIINVGQWFIADRVAVPHTAFKLNLKARKDPGLIGKRDWKTFLLR